MPIKDAQVGKFSLVWGSHKRIIWFLSPVLRDLLLTHEEMTCQCCSICLNIFLFIKATRASNSQGNFFSQLKLQKRHHLPRPQKLYFLEKKLLDGKFQLSSSWLTGKSRKSSVNSVRVGDNIPGGQNLSLQHLLPELHQPWGLHTSRQPHGCHLFAESRPYLVLLSFHLHQCLWKNMI